jgi:hypothetical protein
LRALKNEMVTGFESGTAIVKDQRFPYVRCTDVMAELKAHVDAFAAAGMLQQRADISGKELRVTLIGDKGGDFTKLLLSIWDVTDSLSPLNCVFLGFYKGIEDYDAMQKCLGRSSASWDRSLPFIGCRRSLRYRQRDHRPVQLAGCPLPLLSGLPRVRLI